LNVAAGARPPEIDVEPLIPRAAQLAQQWAAGVSPWRQ
jgi:hypothetical protein